MALENLGAFDDVGAGGAKGHPALNDQHQNLVLVRLADAGPGLERGPAAVGVHHDGAVDNQGGLEFHGVGGVFRNGVAGILDIEEVVLVEFQALVAPTHVGRAVGGAVAEGIAGQGAAVAVSVGVNKAAGGNADDAVVIFGDGAGVFTGDAQLAGGVQAQPRGILGDGQHTQIAGAGDAHQKNLVFGVDGQHLLAVDGLDGGAAVVQAGLVDVEVVPAVLQGFGMLAQVGLQGGLVDLIEEGVEVFLRHLFRVHLRRYLHVGLHFVWAGLFFHRRGVLLFVFFVPAGTHADLLLNGLAALIHHVFDDVGGDDGCGQPFVAQGVHGGLDVDGAPLGDKAVVGVDGNKVENLNQQQTAQEDRQALEGVAPPFGRVGGNGGIARGGSGQNGFAVSRQSGTGSRGTK